MQFGKTGRDAFAGDFAEERTRRTSLAISASGMLNR
jgi:hypothetical protein